MKNEKIVKKIDQSQQKIPEPTGSFILNFFMSIGFLLGGSIVIYAAFCGQLDFDSILFLTIFGLVFLITGIIFLYNVLKQIKLRLNWDKKRNVDVKEEDLTTNEANMYQFMSATQNPNYHMESIDKDLGIKYEPKLKKDKYGNIYFKSETRYGDFYYLGSLLCLVMLTIVIISSIIGMIGFIKNRDYINIVAFLILIPFCVIMDIVCIKNLINEIKEKLNVKKLIKEGKMQKEKMNFGTRLHRIITYIFLLFFGCLIFELIMQEIGHPLLNGFMEIFIISLFVSFAIGVVIYAIYIIIEFVKCLME